MERSLQIIACCLVVLSCGAPVPEQDGGLVDAGYGAVDAGRDTNSSDSGALDAGVDGGAAADAGVLDAGVIDGGVLDAGVTPATLCSNLARQRCGFFVRCSSEEPISDGGDNNRLAASEQAACEALLAVEPACVKAAEGWSKGRSTFDSGGYLACLGSLPSTSCGRDVLLARACRAIPYLRPATPLGALCTRDAECLDGWCSATPLACGACMSYLSPTTHCSRDAQCEPLGFYCPGADTSTGASGLPCAPRKLAGAQCRTGTLAQNAQEEECAPGLVCAKPGGIWQCTAAKALNTPCQKGAFECFRSGRGVNETVCTTTLEPDGGTSSRCAPFHMQLGSTTPCFAGETENIFDSPNAPVCPEDMYCSSWFCQPRLGAGRRAPVPSNVRPALRARSTEPPKSASLTGMSAIRASSALRTARVCSNAEAMVGAWVAASPRTRLPAKCAPAASTGDDCVRVVSASSTPMAASTRPAGH